MSTVPGGNVAWLFPAFSMRLQNVRRDDIDGYTEVVEELLQRAQTAVPIHLEKFDDPERVTLDNPREDDLQLQYACYIDNCAAAEVLGRTFDRCDFTAGYSMGLFAALHHAGAVTFEDGLRLLHSICNLAHDCVIGRSFGMGTVIGLTPEEVVHAAQACHSQVEISDLCGPKVVVFSGPRSDVESVLEACLAAGCLRARLVEAQLPFHSSWLNPVEARIRQLLQQFSISRPHCGIVSSITQDVITEPDHVRDELCRNVCRPMNWLATLRTLTRLDVVTAIEAGFSESLTNIVKRNYKRGFVMHNLQQLATAIG